MKKTIAGLLLLIGMAQAETLVITCVFEDVYQYGSSSSSELFCPKLKGRQTMETLYKDGWRYVGSYHALLVGGTNYKTTESGVTLVFEKERKEKQCKE